MTGKRGMAGLLMLGLAVLWTFAAGAWAYAAPVSVGVTPPPPVTAKAAMLIDAGSGKVLWEKNAHERLPMASVTKLMTLVLAFRAIQHGKASMRDLVPVSMEAYRTGGSQIWLEPGERLTLRQMLTAIAVGSANDAAVAVGEYLAGSTGQFVQLMNQEAARLGMRDTHFSNPHGLPALDHYSTAHDLALLAARAVKIPGLLRLTSMWQDKTIRNGKGGYLWLVNHNRLLRSYPGADGLKTGYTHAAGFCLVATAVRGPTRMIAVILGAPTSKDRFDDAASLMSWGFSNFTSVAVVRSRDVLGAVRVLRGSAKTVQAVAAQTLQITMTRGESRTLTQSIRLVPKVGAPVASGQRLGTLTVRRGSTTVAQVPLVAAHSVRAIGVPELLWRYFWRILA